jgi:hypothetical protein
MLQRSDGVCHLLYAGEVHMIVGEPESTKTWLACAACYEQVRAKRPVLYLDFEASSAVLHERFKSLGTNNRQLGRVHYVRAETPLDEANWKCLEAALDKAPAIVIIDGLTAALALHGKDPDRHQDVADFLATTAVPLTRNGAAVLITDHVVKDPGKRGVFAIGSEHKKAAAAVTVRVDRTEAVGRGRSGAARITILKDRHGYLRQYEDSAGVIGELRIDATEEPVRMSFDPPATAIDRTETLLCQVAEVIAAHEPISKTRVAKTVGGNKQAVFKAIEKLQERDCINIDTSGREHLCTSLRPYPPA